MGKSSLYSGNVVVFEQKWLYTDKCGCNRVKLVVFGQGCRIRAKWLYSGRTGCIREKRIYSGKGGFLRTKVFLFGQKLL